MTCSAVSAEVLAAFSGEPLSRDLTSFKSNTAQNGRIEKFPTAVAEVQTMTGKEAEEKLWQAAKRSKENGEGIHTDKIKASPQRFLMLIAMYDLWLRGDPRFTSCNTFGHF